MTWLAFLRLIGGWRAAAFLSVAVAALAWGGVQTWRLDTTTDELDVQTRLAEAGVAVNATNVQTIAELRKANAEFAAAAEAKTKAAEESVAAVTSERDALAAELERRRVARERLYEKDMPAAEWSRARVPDAVLDSLRK